MASSSIGYIYESMTGVYNLSGSQTRTPGEYRQIDVFTDRPTRRNLRHTNEFIHASVRSRIGLEGPGIEDKGTYRPEALRGWHNVVMTGDGGRREVRWELRSRRGEVEQYLVEDRIGDVERELLMLSPDIADRVLGTNRQRKLLK